MRRLTVLCAATALLFALAGCTDDDSSEEGEADVAAEDSTPDPAPIGGADDFCAAAEEQVELFEGESDDLPGDEALAQLDELAAAAPPEVEEEMATLRDGYEQLAAVDGGDPDSIEQAFDVLFDQDFIGAAEAVGTYLEEECGFDVETPSEGGGGSSGDPDDDEPSPGEVDTGAVRDFLAAEDPTLEDRVQSIASFSGVELTVGVVDLTDPDEGVEICEVLSTYLYDEVGAGDTTIKVQDTQTEDVAVREGEDGACEAA